MRNSIEQIKYLTLFLIMKIAKITTVSALFVWAALSAYAQQEISLDGNFDSDVQWSEANWSPQAPTAEDDVIINMGEENQGSLVVDGDIDVNRLTLNRYAKLLASGAESSLTSAFDIILNDNSSLLVNNGASLSLEGIFSAIVNENASFTVDNATFNGKFHYSAYNVQILNGSTWNIGADMNGVDNGDILVKDSTVNLISDLKMKAGTALNFTLDNSTLGGTENAKKGINFGGNVNILNGSKVQYIEHFNVGRENGGASRDTTVTVKGSSAENLSSINAANGWLNVNEGGASKLVLAGFSDVDFTSKIDVNNTSGGNFEIVFENSNNKLYVGGHTVFGQKDSAAKSGNWCIRTESGATNSSFTTLGVLDMYVSAEEGNSATVGIDWSGDGNVLSIGDDWYEGVYMKGSKASSGNSHMYMRVSNGGTFILKDVNIGGDNLADSSVSGLTEFVVANGGKVSANNIRINNSGVAGATSVSKLVFDNANYHVGEDGNSMGNVAIGGFNGSAQNATADTIRGGTAILEVINGSDVLLSGNIDMITSNSADSTSVSKLLVENSTLKINGELKAAHKDTGLFSSGSAILEVTGENSVFEATNKGFYSGYETDMSGGSIEVLLSGQNNRISFANEAAENSIEKFYMFAAGTSTGTQTGGTIDVKVTGSGNVFEAIGIEIGKTISTGGKNTFYAKGDSASALNTLRFFGDTLSIHGSEKASATIENSFIMAGNTELLRTDNRRVSVNVGNDANTAGGSASFIVKGSGNVVKGWDFRVGSSSATGGTALARFEGYSNDIRFDNTLSFAGSGKSYADAVGGRFEFVLDNSGAGLGEAMLNVGRIDVFSGAIQVDFSALSGEFNGAEFLLIASATDWYDLYSSWEQSGLFDFNLRDESDEAHFEYSGGYLFVVYTSTVPEPATFAAIFGLCALAFASYRRRKN